MVDQIDKHIDEIEKGSGGIDTDYQRFRPELSYDIELTDNARTVLTRRYLRRDENGTPVETAEEMFWRVAWHVAAPEEEHGSNRQEVAEHFYYMLTQKLFFPNSPTFTGAGTPLGQLAACFVLPIEDDMGRTGQGIFETLRNAALIQQTGGGNGFAFTTLRPEGAIVKSSNGKATGPIGFLKVYDQAFGEIAQGGTRRGANMAVLRVDHPDIYKFVQSKTSEDAITNFNISVGMTDTFMQAVKDDSDFDLINPQNGEVWKTVRARDLFDHIVEHAYNNGEPGVLFLDAANRTNPVPHLYQLAATNPCGEQFLGPYENCCLGSINLSKHVTEDGQVDWEKLRRTTVLATRFLDDVVDANAYVDAVPELRLAAERVRRIGLGIMGLGDMMYLLGVRYGSEEGQEFASQVMEFIQYHCMQTSINLAKDRTSFLAIRGSMFDPLNVTWEEPTPLMQYTRNWNRPTLDWGKITAGIKEHGIRNGAHSTVAPTGTISTVSGVEGYGCEPVFALAYVRYFDDEGVRRQLQYTSPLLVKALDEAGITGEVRTRIIEQVNLKGSLQDIDEMPDSIKHTFVVSSDVTAEEHVRMQAALQRFVSNAISKTCNFPSTATKQDVAEAYRLGWELGCKGLTVYVAGSRDKVVLETAETAKAKEKDAEPQVEEAQQEASAQKPVVRKPVSSAAAKPAPLPLSYDETKKPRKRRLPGYTYRAKTPLGTTFVTVNENGGSQPFEVFIHTSKAGSETAAVSEAMGRLISYILRMNSDVEPRKRLKEVILQLEGIGGGRPTGLGPNRVRSLPDGVAQILAEYIDEALSAQEAHDQKVGETEVAPSQAQMTMSIGDICPECGQAALVTEEGCRKCYACGYSEC